MIGRVLVLVFFLLPFAASALEVGFAPERQARMDTLVVGVFQGRVLPPSTKAFDDRAGGYLTRLISAGRFSGRQNETTSAILPEGMEADRLLVIGLGPNDLKPASDFEVLGGRIAQTLQSSGTRVATIQLDAVPDNSLDQAEAAARIALGAELGSYRFDTHIHLSPLDQPTLSALRIVTPEPANAQQVYDELEAVASSVTFARDLVNEPANILKPTELVSRLRDLRKLDISIEVLDQRKLRDLNMGAILGVGGGSDDPPYLVLMRWDGGKKGEAPIALAGKGVTFDSGGLNLKDSTNIWQMKYDMTGAAVVAGTIRALALRNAPVNVVALAAIVENMPSGSALHPGDVIRTFNGLTIEVVNTDAEGRLILADTVSYAQQRYTPRLIIDVATLTGSVKRALGDEYGGLFSNNDELAAQLVAAGERSGEPVWRLPLHPSYAGDILSNVADIRNGSGNTLAGAGIGAQVIRTFVRGDTPWAHLDIAGVAWLNSSRSTAPAGATAFGVRLLDQLIRDNYEN